MNEYLEKSAGRGYVERTKDEFDDLLVERLGFEAVIPKGNKITEITYERLSADGLYKVIVFSSLQRGINRTRDCGNDAIRVLMWNVKAERPMKIMGEGRQSKAGKRINRTQGAMRNLERRVKQYLNLGSPKYRCEICGSVMAVRNWDGEKKLACTNRLDANTWCKGRRPAPEWID